MQLISDRTQRRPNNECWQKYTLHTFPMSIHYSIHPLTQAALTHPHTPIICIQSHPSLTHLSIISFRLGLMAHSGEAAAPRILILHLFLSPASSIFNLGDFSLTSIFLQSERLFYHQYFSSIWETFLSPVFFFNLRDFSITGIFLQSYRLFYHRYFSSIWETSLSSVFFFNLRDFSITGIFLQSERLFYHQYLSSIWETFLSPGFFSTWETFYYRYLSSIWETFYFINIYPKSEILDVLLRAILDNSHVRIHTSVYNCVVDSSQSWLWTALGRLIIYTKLDS